MRHEKLDRILDLIPLSENGCKLYTRSLTWDGYARYDGNGVYRVHVYVLERKIGRKLLPGMRALHTCDVRNCVQESHLYEGTHAQNMVDMYSRGRRVFDVDKCITNARLSEKHIPAIRRLHDLGYTNRHIGDVFGLKGRSVSDIVRRITWKHVP